MTDKNKAKNYIQYVISRLEVGETPMPFEQFIESLLAESED